MNDTRKRHIFDATVWSVSLLFAFWLLIDSALAETNRPAATNATWKAECGSCHIAYPPQLLPASAWRRMLARLDQHFGSDASIDPRTASEIGAFLEKNAGERKRSRDSGTLRISETPWFRHKHDEVAAATWKNPRVRSAANCSACHAGAERSEFDERAVRIPR